MTMEFKNPHQEKPKRRMSMIEMAKEEVEQAQNNPSYSSSRENCVNFANQFFDKLKSFASKVCSKSQKEAESDPKLTKYEMTDFMIHDEELYQEFKKVLARDHVVTSMAVNQELNKFLTAKVEKIMLQKKRENELEEKKVSTSHSSDATVEWSDDDDKTVRRRLRRASSCHDDGSVASSANESTNSRRPSWECLFEKMRRRASLSNVHGTRTTDQDAFEGNHPVTGITNRLSRSLSEDAPDNNELKVERANLIFRDDSFLCKLSVAGTIPSFVKADDNDKRTNQRLEAYKITNDDDSRRRHSVSDCESAAFRKMKKRLSCPS